MACDITLPSSTVTGTVGELDVVGKFKNLTEAALGIDSIYMRAKDTFKELFDGKNITADEYSQLAAGFVSNLAVQTTQVAMNTAMQWAQAERDGVLTQETLKAQAELVMAQRERTRLEICQLEKETELKCAQIKATISGSIRENGRIETYAADGCTPLTLHPEGLKYIQQENIAAQKYSTLADTYRKSGVVTIGTTVDGEVKGVSGDALGYTNAQTDFARRQIKSFEDSKRTHAVNASSQMISQLLATEIAPSHEYVGQWNAAMGYLLQDTP